MIESLSSEISASAGENPTELTVSVNGNVLGVGKVNAPFASAILKMEVPLTDIEAASIATPFSSLITPFKTF